MPPLQLLKMSWPRCYDSRDKTLDMGVKHPSNFIKTFSQGPRLRFKLPFFLDGRPKLHKTLKTLIPKTPRTNQPVQSALARLPQVQA